MHQMWPWRVTEPYHVHVFLILLCSTTPPSASPITRATPTKTDRNREIYQRYLAWRKPVTACTRVWNKRTTCFCDYPEVQTSGVTINWSPRNVQTSHKLRSIPCQTKNWPSLAILDKTPASLVRWGSSDQSSVAINKKRNWPRYQDQIGYR